MSVSRGQAGNPQYNFQYVDVLYAALLRMHIRPFVELTFMPSQLASGTKTIFWWKGNITPFFSGSLDEAVKAECAACRVGGPASAMPYAFEEAFENYVVAHHVPADFVATHAYGVTQGFLDADGSAGTVLDPSLDSVSGRMRHSRELLEQSGRPKMELHFTEWSSAYTPTDPIHDQYHQASFILDKIRRAAPYVDSMS